MKDIDRRLRSIKRSSDGFPFFKSGSDRWYFSSPPTAMEVILGLAIHLEPIEITSTDFLLCLSWVCTASTDDRLLILPELGSIEMVVLRSPAFVEKGSSYSSCRRKTKALTLDSRVFLGDTPFSRFHSGYSYFVILGNSRDSERLVPPLNPFVFKTLQPIDVSPLLPSHLFSSLLVDRKF